MKKLKSFILQNVDLQIIFFVLLIPFIDIYDFFIGGKIELFNFSVIELVKIAILCYLLILVLLTKKDKIYKIIKKYKFLLVLTVFLYILFLIGHFYAIYSWDFSLIKGAEKSFLVEFYYIVRTYGVCLLLFFIMMLSDISAEKIIKLISLITFIVCLIIVLSNVTKLGYIAYSSYLDKPKQIGGSIFNWLSSITVYNADQFTTKGFFFSANQLSIVIFAGVLISALYLVKNKKAYLYVTFVIKLLGALMLSTKVCSVGMFLILLLFIFGTLFFNIINRKSISWGKIGYFSLLLVLYFFLFRIAPINYKLNIFVINSKNNDFVSDGLIVNLNPSKDDDSDEDISVYDLAMRNDLTDEEEKLLVEQVVKFRGYLGIDPSFLEIYPVAENIDFWKRMLVLPINHRLDFRLFKNYLYNDVIEKNNNLSVNHLFGIGYVSNLPYMEEDFVAQKAWFGIMGVLSLIGPFIVSFFWSLWYFFRNFKKNFVDENVYVGGTILCLFVISFLAGHLFGNLFPMMILILLLKCFAELNGERKKHEKKCH